jgi:hypothetical protein
MNDEPLPWKMARVSGELLELASTVRQLRRAGLDYATAEFLLCRKRAELESLMRWKSTGNSPREDHIKSR